jgi:hypothetical protein
MEILMNDGLETMFTIRRPPLVVQLDALKSATAELQNFWNELINTFGGEKLSQWSFVFTLPETEYFAGLCDQNIKTVFISTVSISRDLRNGSNLDGLKGVVVHEFCHAWAFEYQHINWLHQFGFHVLVSLLLAKYQLGWDKRLYNFCDDQNGTYNYTPKTLFRLCRYAARHLKTKDDLERISVKIRERFNTNPRQFYWDWRNDSMHPNKIVDMYKILSQVDREKCAALEVKTKFYERSFYSLFALVSCGGFFKLLF